MDKMEIRTEKGEIQTVSQEQKEKLLTAIAEQAMAGLKYIMCMAEEQGGESAQRAGMKYIMCMKEQQTEPAQGGAELAQRAGMKYIMCKVAEEAELAQRAGMKYIMCMKE
jgi:triosephosphate isomerase